jgi:hypothetical protein
MWNELFYVDIIGKNLLIINYTKLLIGELRDVFFK